MSSAVEGAARIVARLLDAGVQEAVLAPGSRSAPLAYALHAADAAGQLRLHVRLDERTAGFLALGLAKGSGQPVPVVTTSGTAAANLHPAVLESRHSGIPLMIITADRPSSMIDTGANQTTRQRGMFGDHAVADAQLDVAAAPGGVIDFQLWRLLAVCSGRRSGRPGPVHLNAAFTDPLVPDGPVIIEPRADWPVAQRVSTSEQVHLEPGPRTVIVAGDAPTAVGQRAARLADAAELPIFAEPSSNARGARHAITGYRLLLTETVIDRIDRVIMFGHPTLSRPVQRLLGRPGLELIIVADGPDWVDPATNAARVVDDVELAAGDVDWGARWRRADDDLRARLAAMAGDGVITGPGLADRLWRRLSGKDALVVGSSNPIRDLDLAGPHPDPPAVYANRGLAGIDGTISTAVGLALAHDRSTSAGSAHALIGDLTALHDLTGLLIGPDEPRPDLRLVVANDGGGSIFATLEQGAPALSPPFERLFGTPQHADLSALCAGLGVPHRRASTDDELADALSVPPAGLELLEVPLDRTSRRALDERQRRLGAEVASRLLVDGLG